MKAARSNLFEKAKSRPQQAKQAIDTLKRQGLVRAGVELLDQGRGVDTGNVLEEERAVERFMTFLTESFPVVFSHFRKAGGSSQMPRVDGIEDETADFDNLRGLRKPESMNAKRYLVEQVPARGYTRTRIADQLGISRKTVYNLLMLQKE